MGYDFHIAPDGPKLIEINTNAGGAFLNAVIVSAMQACCDEVDRAFFTRNPNAFSDHIISMVNAEWALQGLTRPLHHVVIVDDDPQSQYLYPEFKLAQALLERAGFLVTIADPSELNWDGTTLNHNGTKIDLVYNRLVDFMLQEPGHQALRKAYAAAVIDLFSRRVVGWSMSASMTAQLVTDALLMAIWRRGKPNALLHHSDQGSQYTGEPFRRLLEDNGVSCSMSRSGNVWDNAAMESFFSSLKTERTARKVYRSRAEAKADIFDYIERFYNPKLRHSTLGYLSPIEFERKAGLA